MRLWKPNQPQRYADFSAILFSIHPCVSGYLEATFFLDLRDFQEFGDSLQSHR